MRASWNWTITVSYTHLDVYKRQRLKPYGLTFTQLSVLIFLADNQDRTINQKDISMEFDVSHATTVGIVARMHGRSLVKVKACESDRRITNVIITDHGKDMIVQTRKVQEELVQLFSKCLDETEMTNFFKDVYKRQGFFFCCSIRSG